MSSRDTALFVWRSSGQTSQQWGDVAPPATDLVIELIFQRNEAILKRDGVPKHLGHPKHEAALAAQLPTTLQILRLDGCRVRTWPRQLPLGLVEFYASGCDFFRFPDLSAYTQLIAIEMPDNRIEEVTQPLPPNLARLNLDSNALFSVTAVRPATLQNVSCANNPSLKTGWAAPAAVVRRPFGRAPGPTTEAREVNPYKNDHSVHDSGIQGSTKANLTYIAGYKPDVQPFNDLVKSIKRELLKDSPLWKRLWPLSIGSVEQAICNEVALRIGQSYVMHGFTPLEIVDRLWLRILDFPESVRKDVITRFVEEVHEATQHCTNGFMVRMANVLVGFDENIQMKMLPAQILQARVPATLERLRKALPPGEPEPWTYWRDALKQTWEDMEEIEMDMKDRGTWLQELFDPIADRMATGIHRMDPDLDKRIGDHIEESGLMWPWECEIAKALPTDKPITRTIQSFLGAWIASEVRSKKEVIADTLLEEREKETVRLLTD